MLSSDLQNYTVDFFKKINCIYNFADDNTISAVSKGTDDLLITLMKNESVLAVKWFRQNDINSVGFRQWFCRNRIKIVELIH